MVGYWCIEYITGYPRAELHDTLEKAQSFSRNPGGEFPDANDKVVVFYDYETVRSWFKQWWETPALEDSVFSGIFADWIEDNAEPSESKTLLQTFLRKRCSNPEESIPW